MRIEGRNRVGGKNGKILHGKGFDLRKNEQKQKRSLGLFNLEKAYGFVLHFTIQSGKKEKNGKGLFETVCLWKVRVHHLNNQKC